jgi:protein-disulfide isomerase
MSEYRDITVFWRNNVIHMFARFVRIHPLCIAALVCLPLFTIQIAAQQQVSNTPVQEMYSRVPAPPANTPTRETINSFLQASWGYIDMRTWQIQAIEKTSVEGISKVIVLVSDKGDKQKAKQLEFFTLPDGKHIIDIGSNEVLSFGEHPFAEVRTILQQRADGPFRGSASKDLELVEFADLQCPLCKEEQVSMDKLAVDFPNARIVFQNLPLEHIHSAAAKAAAYGACVNKEGGSNAFFLFASTVFEGQAGLATADGATLTLNSAVTKAGLDPAKIADCAATPETKVLVRASAKLAKDLNIGQTPGQVPTLVVNGRVIPMGGIPYETLRQIVAYQAKLDGVSY